MTPDLTDDLAAVIRGDQAAAARLDAAGAADVCAAADAHGVLPLLAHHLTAIHGARPLDAALAVEARRRVAADIVRTHELQQCLSALDRAGIPLVVFKGAQLAFSHYARPDLRPRVDSDVLVPSDAVKHVQSALAACGHAPEPQLPGTLVMYQAAYAKRHGGALVHTLDVHWRVANPQAFGSVLTYGELAESAVPIPSLSPTARGPSPPHVLLLACVHRVAHHFDACYLLWLYDIHLVASRLTEAEWSGFARLAKERGVATVCEQSIRRAMHYFQTEVPSSILTSLSAERGSATEIATAGYMGRRRHIANIMADVQSIPAWSGRARLLMEHLFPPADYMRTVYAPSSNASLPVLYARRAMRGARKWLRRT